MEKEVINILESARKELLTNGWCKGEASKGKQCCILYAMEKHTFNGYNIHTQKAEELVKDVMDIQGSITSWNDAKTRTKKEVIEALDLTISAAYSEI